MHNRIRPYAWGSRTAIAELLGEPSPAPHPQAELWIGAHPADSSSLLDLDPDGIPVREASLADVIATDPTAALGPAVLQRFGPRLPFLLKVLAAAEPLSLQAHPTTEQAELGFVREEAAGMPLNSPNRNYKDRSHKPELICALTEFHALCGFRDPHRTVSLLADLQVPQLDHYLALLAGQPDPDGMRALFSSLITIPVSLLEPLLTDVFAACVARIAEGHPGSTEYRTALQLGERYPGDPGVLAALLLNRITLTPGQALTLPAGNLHAYLSGVGVEIMANSDNVLRGGLTPKHVDVPELMRVLDFSAGDVPVLGGHPGRAGEWVYTTGNAEFELSRIELSGDEWDLTHDGPQVLLAVDGECAVQDAAGTSITVRRGRSVWISAEDRGVRIKGDGTVFRATDGLVAAAGTGGVVEALPGTGDEGGRVVVDPGSAGEGDRQAAPRRPE
ncbi:mannose-6-phosphate isomerase, class I [Nakamurella sp. YIM 132084]|uniref:mannose-6-phosphate isomerase n=2 Tax=Nakamurella leprariae TaxID=2803911 RepID=A0A938YDT3_9ACTN|nr:mannose-6-phosphate isomerase, class I [Nakamurella leprariae]MBM9467736.1 mannose-6-phosphate isomerase, class I [Nakamurella leprariae]